MPQGTDSKFLVNGACLLMWMASAQSRQSAMAQKKCSTPVILAQLGECGVCNLPGMCNLPIQPANSTDTRA